MGWRSATLDGESRDPSAGIGEEVLAAVSSPCRDEDGAGPGETNERGPDMKGIIVGLEISKSYCIFNVHLLTSLLS